MKKSEAVAGRCLLLLVLLAGDALADAKTYHGAVCHSVDRGQQLRYLPAGVEIDNNDGDIVCPLVRDNINATNNIEKVWVEITNFDDNDDLDVSCTLLTQREDSQSSTIMDVEVDSASNEGFVQLVFDQIDTFNGNEGSYSLECSLGRGDILTQITVHEQN